MRKTSFSIWYHPIQMITNKSLKQNSRWTLLQSEILLNGKGWRKFLIPINHPKSNRFSKAWKVFLKKCSTTPSLQNINKTKDKWKNKNKTNSQTILNNWVPFLKFYSMNLKMINRVSIALQISQLHRSQSKNYWIWSRPIKIGFLPPLNCLTRFQMILHWNSFQEYLRKKLSQTKITKSMSIYWSLSQTLISRNWPTISLL